MPKFRFIGDPRANGHGPDEVELFGAVFNRLDWTEVEGEAAEKAARHTHLEQEGSPEQAPKRRGRPPKVRED